MFVRSPLGRAFTVLAVPLVALTAALLRAVFHLLED